MPHEHASHFTFGILTFSHFPIRHSHILSFSHSAFSHSLISHCVLQLAVCVRYPPGCYRWWQTCSRCNKAKSSWNGPDDCIGTLERHSNYNCQGGGAFTKEELADYRRTMMLWVPDDDDVAWESYTADLLSFLLHFRIAHRFMLFT